MASDIELLEKAMINFLSQGTNEDVSLVVADTSIPEGSTGPNVCLSSVNTLPNNNAVSETAGPSGTSASCNENFPIYSSYFHKKDIPYEHLKKMFEQILFNFDSMCPKKSSNLKRPCSATSGMSENDSEMSDNDSEMSEHEPEMKKVKTTCLDTLENCLSNELRNLNQKPKLPCASSSSFTCNEENSGENYFECLPFLVVENILSRLPFSDLMKARAVCKLWKQIIDKPKFLRWKKLYYEMTFKPTGSSCYQNATLFFDKENVTVQDCLHTLISHMNDKYVLKPPKGLETYLDSIPSCITAKDLLLRRFSENPSLCENPLCILAVTIILSSTVKDLYDIFHRLIYVHHCDYDDILEAMYCIATLFLYLMHTFSINPGIHYRLYSVINLFENDIPVNNPAFSVRPETKLPEQENSQNIGQPLVTQLKLTNEQIEILNHELAPSDIIKISSFAGTGKTTTLMQLSKKYSNLKFLYLTCKQSSSEYVASRCPPNVVCTTLDAMAYEAIGKYYKHKLTDKLSAYDIMPFVHRWACFSTFQRSFAESVFKTIEVFNQSKLDSISSIHVRTPDSKIMDKLKLFNQTDSNSFNRFRLMHLIILNEAKEVWKKMVSLDSACKISPSIYLKLYQLSKPCLLNYDCIMIDEAEDFVEVMLSITLSQNLPTILAGDPNQQLVEYNFIYSLRTWTFINATHTYLLTKCFRFGPEIAYVTNCCFQTLTRNTKSTLVGSLKESYVDGTIKGQYAIIAHTNEALFKEIVRLCCSLDRQPNEPMFFQAAFVGGLPTAYLDQIIDIYKLMCDEPNCDIKDEFIKKFKNLYWLQRHVKIKKDTDISMKIKMVQDYSNKIVSVVDKIKKMCSYDIADADIVFCTVHNAKGLEFDTVRLVGDFYSEKLSNISYFLALLHNPYYGEGAQDCFGQQIRHNNLYVAITRAKTCLIFFEDLFYCLLLAHENFEYPIASSALLESSPSLKCASCAKTFIPSTVLTMICRNMTLASGRQIRGGPLCINCATCPNYRQSFNRRSKLLPPSDLKDVHHISLADFVGS